MIELTELTKRYGNTVAVDNLSFTVRPGAVTGFLGPNGAGKSTTMRMILGIDRPTAGQARIDGRPYQELEHPIRTVGALLDAGWVHPHRSARSHLRWWARAGGLPAARVDEVLDAVGLTAVADRRAGVFSLGMRQRLGIAGALLGDPAVLLFDEVINGLDPEGIHWMRSLMQRLAAEGRTVLVSSHLLSETALTATELVVIGRGRLVAQGPTEEFVGRVATQSVRVRTRQPSALAAALQEAGYVARQAGEEGALDVEGATTDDIGDIAAERRLVVLELRAVRGSLEEAFLELTKPDVEYSAPVVA